MQYLYVLEYSMPNRYCIKVADDVDIPERLEDILKHYGLREDQCEWLISHYIIDQEEPDEVLTNKDI